MTKSVKLMTGILGFLMLVSGMAKFHEPFRSMYATQIIESQLPYPMFAFWGGPVVELVVAFILLSLVIFSAKMSLRLINLFFVAGNLMVLAIMRVTLYMQFHPAVPVEALPFETKVPFLAVATVLLVALNLHINRMRPEDPHLNTINTTLEPSFDASS